MRTQVTETGLVFAAGQEPQPRIMISQLHGIRDTILTLPVVAAIRESYPRAFIAWVVEGAAAAVVRNHCYLDATVIVEDGWHLTPTRLWGLRRRLRALNFDTAIDFQGSFRSALACYLAGAPRRIGGSERFACKLGRRVNNIPVSVRQTYITDRALALLKPLAINQPAIRHHLPISLEANAWARVWRRGHVGRLAIVHVDASNESTCWPLDRFAAVIEYLTGFHHTNTVLAWRDERERELALELVELSGNHATLAPETDLTHLAAMIKHADVFLGVDSIPLQLAVATGTPTVSLYDPVQAAFTAPHGSQHAVIRMASSSARSRNYGGSRFGAASSIQSEEVCRQLDRLLQPADLLAA